MAPLWRSILPSLNRAGLHSIRINNPWRIVFRWAPSEANDVQIIDYH
jgi:proteic killer suppression protein